VHVRRFVSRAILIDPDGTAPPYIGLLVPMRTDVVYHQQCGGVETVERLQEGFYVALGGAKLDAEAGMLSVAELTAVFHREEDCTYGGAPHHGEPLLPAHRLEILCALVETIPYWTFTATAEATGRVPLRIDQKRYHEILEAWVPVLTPDGPAILTWSNCD
jgi:hypothetical protein